MMKHFFGILYSIALLIPGSNFAQDTAITLSENLQLMPISDTVYRHVSHYTYPSGSRYSANGLVYISHQSALIIDTPWTDVETKQLIDFLQDSLKVSIEAVIPTHWHIDCMGGLGVIKQMGIKSYAHQLTCEIAADNSLPVSQFSFSDSLHILLAGKDVLCRHLGAGHTVDNIVVWIPQEGILFGGCMVRSIRTGNLGFTGDAVLEEWPGTLQKALEAFPEAKLIIPGHGEPGDQSLIRHTMQLLEERSK